MSPRIALFRRETEDRTRTPTLRDDARVDVDSTEERGASRRLSRSLLRLMSRPTHSIARVDERCEITDDELVRTVRLSLTPPTKPGGTHRPAQEAGWLIDLVHPKKGSLTPVEEVSAPLPVRELSHDEHLQVSSGLIRYRGTSLFKGAPLIGATEDERNRFVHAMRAVVSDLSLLPNLDPAEASELLNRSFDRTSGVLRACLSTQGCQLDARKVTGFYSLCEELASRYLVLVELKNPAAVQGVEVQYRYRDRVSEIRTVSATRSSVRLFRRIRGRLTEGRHQRYATFPAAFVVHIPWARRTNHYTLSIDAPSGFFFARQTPLGDPPDDGHRQDDTGLLTALDTQNSEGAGWSFRTGRGRRCRAFIGHGPREGRRLYIGLLNLELPGRSTSQTAGLAWLTTLALTGFLFLAEWTTTPVAEAVALVTGVLALGNFGIGTLLNRSHVGQPLISRFVPGALSLLAGLFAAWLLSRDATLTVPEPLSDTTNSLQTLWSAWVDFGGLMLATGAASLSIWVSSRRRRLALLFRQQASREQLAGGSMSTSATNRRSDTPRKPATRQDDALPVGDPVNEEGEWVPKGGTRFIHSSIFDPRNGSEQDGLDDVLDEDNDALVGYLDELDRSMRASNFDPNEDSDQYFELHPKKLKKLLRLAAIRSEPPEEAPTRERYIVRQPGKVYLVRPSGESIQVPTDSDASENEPSSRRGWPRPLLARKPPA